MLVVDDNPAFGRAVSHLLETLEVEVLGVAATVAEGLALAVARRPDVVLMDVLLPDGDGIAAAARLAGEPGVTTVVMSLREDAAFRTRALEAGAVAFIGKSELDRELAPVLEAIQRRTDTMDGGAWGPEDEVTRDLGGRPPSWSSETEDLERLDRLELTALVSSGLAHDLNTPLAALHIELATLARHITELEQAATPPGGATPPRVAAGITRARGSAVVIDEVASYMTRLVRDFTRFTRGKRPAQGIADVKGAVDTAVRFSHAVSAHRATLALRVPRGLLVRVPERTLVRVLINLVVNAAEAFARADTLKNQIVVSADRRGDRVWVEIADNAMGIAPEMRAHLFEPWRTTKRGERGLGLGLAVARSLLREAGGELELVETGPDGTRFRCVLPVGR